MQITIDVEDRHLHLLRHWASIGRTIDAAVDQIEDEDVAVELLDLKPALMAIHFAIRDALRIAR